MPSEQSESAHLMPCGGRGSEEGNGMANLMASLDDLGSVCCS